MRELRRGRVRAVAALAAVVVALVAPCALADGPGARDATSHVLIGVSHGSLFGVVVDGEVLPEGPVESDPLGILEFAVDDGASGAHTVSFSIAEALVLSSVVVDSVTSSSAVVRWQTNIPSNSSIEYGLTYDYGDDTGVDPEMTLSHRMLIEGLAPASTYHFRAVSTDAFDRTAVSGDHVLETAPSPLEIADVTVSGVGPTWAVIGWTTTRPATSRVEYGLTDGYGQESSEDTLAVLEHSVMLTGLSDGTSYHFRAHSRDGYGLDASSPDSTFTTMELEPTGPPIIGDVAALAESVNSVVVTWTTDRPATSRVRYGTNGDLDCSTQPDPALVTDHVVRVGPVAPRHEYTFVVLSACGADTAESAARVFATELPEASINEGKGVTIARPGIACLAETTATIAWSTDRPCTTWVEYGIDKDLGSPSFQLPTRGYTYEASLSGLAPGTLYYYRVCAWDEFGGTVYHGLGTFETYELVDPDPPESPGGLSGIVVEGGVSLEWVPCVEEDLRGYYVYRLETARPDGGQHPFDIDRAVRLNDLPLSNASYFDDDIDADTTYEYAVSAVDLVGNESAPSSPVTVRCSSGFAEFRLSILPNPSFGSATLAYAAAPGALIHVRIYTATGRLVREISCTAAASGEGSLAWDGRDLVNRPVGSGIYLCELSAGGESVRRKFTVLR